MPQAKVYAGSSLYELNAGSIQCFGMSADMGGPGIGRAVSARYSLAFLPPEGLSEGDLYGARVVTRLRGGAAGVWYVASVRREAGSPFITVTGYDAIGTFLGAAWQDSAALYPLSAAGLLRCVIAAAPGLTLATDDFPGAGKTIKRRPEWAEGTTARQVLGHIAFLAGGNAVVDSEGRLVIVPFAGAGTGVTGDTDLYGGAPFRFNCLRYLFDGDALCTRFALDTALGDDSANTLTAGGNPLITRELAAEIAARLGVRELHGGCVRLFTPPPALPGETVTAEGRDIFVSSLRLKADVNGCRCVISGRVPEKKSVSPAGSGILRADGTVSAESVSGLDNRITGLSRAYISQLTADEIYASGLITRMAEAASLRAGDISAGSTETDSLTAALADIVRASVRKLNAGTVEADALSAGIADIAAAHIGSLDADSLTADSLAAALARFTVMTAGSARFDSATVRHLLSECLNIEEASGGNVFISNLTADYAQLVNASVGSLCVRAADGSFYRLEVDENGSVSARREELTEGELAEGRTLSGRTILETNIAASELCASDIRAARALINRLDAARLDVGTLVAQNAFADWLHTGNLSANESLRISLESVKSGIPGVYRQEETPAGSVPEGSLWVKPSEGVIYQLTEDGALPAGAAACVDDGMNLIWSLPGEASLQEGTLIADAGGDQFRLSLSEEMCLMAASYSWEPVRDGELSGLAADIRDIHRYMTFDEDGLTQRKPGSVYLTRVDENGFEVLSDREVSPIASMSADDGIAARRITMGDIVCRRTDTGGWAWQIKEDA